MAILEWDLGNLPGSRSCFLEALKAFRDVGDLRSADFCITSLELIRLYEEGKKDREANDFFRSLERFAEAILLGRSLGFPDFEVKCLRQQGLTYWEMGRVDLFQDRSVRGLKIAERLHHQVELGRCLNNIGVSYHRKNEYSLALDNLENALSVIRSAGDKQTEAECLSNLGILFRDLGNYSRARYFLSSALNLDRERHDAGSLSADLGNLGTVLLRSGVDTQNRQDLFQSLEALKECVSLQRADGPITYIELMALNNIGIIYNELGDRLNSRRYFEVALKAVEDKRYVLEKGHILSNLAASYLYENRLDDAIHYYQMSYDLGAGHSFENVVMEASFGLGRCFELGRSRDKALDHYQTSIRTMENVRERLTSEILTIGFARNKRSVYQNTIKVLSDAYRERPSQTLIEQIFDVMERSKAQAFLDNLREAALPKTDLGPRFLSGQRQKLSENILELAEKLTNPDLQDKERVLLNSELEHLEDEHSRLAAEMKVDRQESNDPSLDEDRSLGRIQREIADDRTILLEYALGEEESYLVLITRKNADLFPLAGKAELGRSLRAYLKMISERAIDEHAGHRASERIGRELLPCIGRKEFDDATNLVIIPDGVLHYLPFETLRVKANGDYRYLTETRAISYGPSASSLTVLRNAKKDRRWTKEILAIGGPRYGQGVGRADGSGSTPVTALQRLYGERVFDLPPLPHSRAEVQGIAGLFSDEEASVLVGEGASEEAVKACPLDDYRIIHFACHGILDENHPFRSALVLSLIAGQGNDGLLQMREISELTTDADLVVLSACRSARGLLEDAEGPMGLARSFFSAGARSVLASLWSVNDRAAVFFMQEFYKDYLSGHSAREALRTAKMKMLKTAWKHPFYWAGFVLVGDPETGPPQLTGKSGRSLVMDSEPRQR